MREHPNWLIKRAPRAEVLAEMKALFSELSLHTVCESALCPNLGECFSKGTATFLLMGDVCTRYCRFCAIRKGRPFRLDLDEPQHVAQAVARLKLRYVVLTSVTRDDQPDGGAAHFARTVAVIRQSSPKTAVEALVPDFQGSAEALKIVVDSQPNVISHNIETVFSLYSSVRPHADYGRSLELLRAVKARNNGIFTKSGLMLGLGERKAEIIKVMQDLRSIGCDFLTIGQYMSPSLSHHPVVGYVPPDEFAEYKSLGEEMGFRSVASGVFVRSSFNAAEMLVNQRPDLQSNTPD